MATAKYTKNAIQSYRDRHDMVQVAMPKGTKDRINELTGESINGFINRLVLAELDRLENKSEYPKQTETISIPIADTSIDPGFYQPVDMSKYQDFPTLAPIPQPTMSAEDEAKALRELQKKIDARNGNMPRTNEKPPESILEGTGKEMGTKGDKTAQNGNMESVGDILENFMNPPETDFLTQKEQEINDRLKQKAEDDEKFKPMKEKEIEGFIQKHGMDLANDSELINQITKEHGKTNYERIIAEMKHRRMIR